MNFQNGFMKNTITCSGHKEVDLDALNLIASGARDCLCTCSYANEKGHHHFIYQTDALTPFVHMRAGMTFAEAVHLLEAGLAVVRMVRAGELVADNLRLTKEYIFCTREKFKFVYIPIASKSHVHLRDLVLKLLAVIPFKNEYIARLTKDIKKAKLDSQVEAMLENFLRPYTAASAPAAPAQAEGETTVLSQPAPEPAFAEGETTVLSQPAPEPAFAEGETTVLSQPAPAPAPAEGETTILSQQLPEMMEDVQHTVYSENASDRLTVFVPRESSEYETTVLSEQTQEPQRTVITGQHGNYRLCLIRNSTSEKIAVDVTPFSIGKDRQTVDYALDSISVSRNHATILFEDGSYFIVDNGSTNGTVIEGIRLQPHERVELGNGYLISLGNESFQALLERR